MRLPIYTGLTSMGKSICTSGNLTACNVIRYSNTKTTPLLCFSHYFTVFVQKAGIIWHIMVYTDISIL